MPRTIDDLDAHRLLHYSHLASGNFWRLRGPSGEERQVRVGGRLTVNNGEALLKAAEAGLGIAQVPDFMLRDAVARRTAGRGAARPAGRTSSASTRSIPRAGSRSRSCAPSSTSWPSGSRAAGPATWP